MLQIPEMTERTRSLMEEIWAADTFQSSNLNARGHAAYREAMTRHVRGGDITSLHSEVASYDENYTKPDRRGVLASDWARRLVLTDYLSLYNCARARELLENGETHAVVVRIGEAYMPRGACEQLENLAVPLDAVANSFRAQYHPLPNRGAFSIPLGPNCHHGIRQLTHDEKNQPYSEQQLSGITLRAFAT